MKAFVSTALGVSLLASSLVYASCPPVVGYTLQGDNGNMCTYTSNKLVRLNLVPHQQNACPRFILTDPHYSVIRCKVDIKLTRCVCHIQSNGR